VEATHNFRLLGPLEALAGGAPLDLGGPKQRAVLALLLLRANEVVPRERLIDALWGEAPPPAARETLKVYVGRLRKLFAATGTRPRLVTRGGGYVLEVDPEQLDFYRFERLAQRGSRALAAGDAEAASSLLRDALGVWRGIALADLGDAAFVRAEQDRLEELRLAALVERVDADLGSGRELELVPELERLVLEHPFRERFRAQLMLALYRCGRQAEALESYRLAAKLFVEDLGIEPGPELRERQRAILEHDPALRLPELADPNLPSPPNALIGRERELAELAALLFEPGTRLVTVLGSGGSGKTRIALEVARRFAAAASVPAFFVDLAPLAEPESVMPAIARSIGLEHEGPTPLIEALMHVLGIRRLLLVLDNVEHLLGAAAAVAELITAAPGLTVLATSRSPLRVRAEWRYELGRLRPDDAVALFVERARAIRRGFTATAAVGELCERIDALPLPIEIAAARTDRLPPDAMLAALDRRLDLLRDGARDLPHRQRSLRATLDWSYELLDDAARVLLARLAVFAGGCTPAAAIRVCDTTPEAIDTLADAAFVRREGERILMLETIREYALERLRGSDGEDELCRLHAQHYTEFVDAARSGLGQAETVAGVEADADNVRAALRWSSQAQDTNLHLRLLVAAAPFWSMRGQLEEIDAWLRPAVARAAAAAPALRASVLTVASSIAGRIGDLGRASELALAAWRLCRALGNDRGAAAALVSAMLAASRAGDTTRRDALLAELDAATHDLPDPVLRAGALRLLGATVARGGDHERGRKLAKESLAVARGAGLELDIGQALGHLGVIALRAGRFEEAREPLEESLAISHKLAYREAAAYSLSGLASLAVAEDDVPRAARLLAAADALFEQIGTTRLPFIDDLDAATRAAVMESIGEHAFARARADARAATFDELIARAAGGVTPAT
jgi:predicted ATPase/DNA-binding SARP family transcriptional activator